MNHNDASYLFFNLWAENNIFTNHPKYGLIPFKQHPHHKTVADAIEENRFVIINKFRQAGITTECAAYAIWDAIWHPDKNILFFTKTDREAIYLCHMAQAMLTHMPEQPMIGEIKPSFMNDHHIKFDHSNSEIRFLKCGAMKAKAVTHLFIDEAAFIPHMDSHWRAIYPILSTGGKCTVVSTPNGAEGWFYETFNNAIQGKNDFKPIRLNWRDHPEYNNPEWEVHMLDCLGAIGFVQEVAGCFLTPESKLKKEADEKIQMFSQIKKMRENHVMSDFDIFTKIFGYSEEEADKMISRMKIQKLEELKLQFMARNPQILGVTLPGQEQND